jgi:WXG100 family type VII secretion target
MSSEIIKLDYGKAEEMIKTFDQGAQQLQTTLQEMQNLANMLEGGALLGDGGSAFCDAIRGKLCPAIQKLDAKFKELSKDVKGAVSDMRQADAASKGMF